MLFIGLWAASLSARTWTDVHGKKYQGKFIRYFEGNVVLQYGNKPLMVSFRSLSDEDQEYVRQQLGAKGQADLLPSPSPHSSKDDGDDAVDMFEDFKLPSPDAERVWVDTKGKQATAQLLGVSGKSAIMRFQDRELMIPLKRLCFEDQRYIQEVHRKQTADEVAKATQNRVPANEEKRAFRPPRASPVVSIPNPRPGPIPPSEPITPPMPTIPPMPPGNLIARNLPLPAASPSPSFPPPINNNAGTVVNGHELNQSLANGTPDIGTMLVGWAVLFVVGTLISAGVLQLACLLLNALMGAKTVPTPTYGHALGICFGLALLNFVVNIVYGFLAKQMPPALVLASAPVVLIGLVWMSVQIIANSLPTTGGRAFLIIIMEYVVGFFVGCILINLFMSSLFSIQHMRF